VIPGFFLYFITSWLYNLLRSYILYFSGKPALIFL